MLSLLIPVLVQVQVARINRSLAIMEAIMASSSHMPRRPDIFRMDQDSEIHSEADDLDDHIDEQQSTISAKSEAAAELGREQLEAARESARPFLHRIYEKKPGSTIKQRERHFPQANGGKPEEDSVRCSESRRATGDKII